MTAGCQISANTEADSTTSDLRIVSTVDSLDYNKVGFKIKMGTYEHVYETTIVLKEIRTETAGLEYSKKPEIFHENAKWFFIFRLININNKQFKEGVYITPYWETLDGTMVEGISRYARVEDGINGYMNVPVRVYADTDVAAGYLEVNYDETKFELVDWDKGSLFEEIETKNDDKNGVVSCVASRAKVNSNIRADGMYVNLRFKAKAGVTELPTGGTFTTFEIAEENFCDWKEILQKVNVVEAVYKSFD